MLDIEYGTEDYKFLEISIGGIIKNLELLKFIPDHLKTEISGKHWVKKWHCVRLNKCVIKLVLKIAEY